MVGVQVQRQPDQNDYGKCDEACTVFHTCKKWQQKDPEDNVIGKADQGKGMQAPLLDWNVTIGILSEPREPHGRMPFDNRSI